VSTKFIVLGRRCQAVTASFGTTKQSSSPQFWIADESGSATLVFAGRDAPDESSISPGEIFLVRNAEAFVNADGFLHLSVSSYSVLERVGFLTLAFKKEPDVSAHPWKKHAESSKQAVSGWDTTRVPEVTPVTGSGAQKGAGGCFLCGDVNHGAPDCPFLQSGVYFKCETLKNAGRREYYILRAALRDSNLPVPTRMQSYRKNDAHALYACFETPEQAVQLLETKNFEIDGQPVRVFSIRGTAKRQRNTDGTDESHRETKLAKIADPVDGNSSSLRETDQSGCPVCSSNEHSMTGCPKAKLCVRITGLSSTHSNAEIQGMLSGLDVQMVSASLHREKWLVQLENKGQVQKLCHAASRGKVRFNSTRLSVHGVLPAKGKQEQEEGNSQTECQLCGQTTHDMSNCTERSRCVQTWGIEETDENLCSIRQALKRHGFIAERLQFVTKKRCMVCLSTEEEAARCMKAAKDSEGLSACDPTEGVEGIRIKFFPLPACKRKCKQMKGKQVGCTPAKPCDATPGDVPQSHFEATSKKTCTLQQMTKRTGSGRKMCFLCGETGHELPSCPVQGECVLICREWGGANPGIVENQQPLDKDIRLTIQDAGCAIKRLYQHKGVCYTHMGSKDDAIKLLTKYGRQGVKIGQDLFRVRPAKTTRTLATSLAQKHKDNKIRLEEDTSECLLCGAADHVLRNCLDLHCGAIIRGSRMQEAPDHGEAEVLRSLQEFGCLPPKRVRHHKGALCLTLASKTDVDELVSLAVGEGLEINEEMVSVQSAVQASAPCTEIAANTTGKQHTKLDGLTPTTRSQ